MRSSPFWDFTQRRLVVSFGTLEDGTDRLSRNASNYLSTLRKPPKERRSQECYSWKSLNKGLILLWTKNNRMTRSYSYLAPLLGVRNVPGSNLGFENCLPGIFRSFSHFLDWNSGHLKSDREGFLTIHQSLITQPFNMMRSGVTDSIVKWTLG
jgi:hypothetical protein